MSRIDVRVPPKVMNFHVTNRCPVSSKVMSWQIIVEKCEKPIFGCLTIPWGFTKEFRGSPFLATYSDFGKDIILRHFYMKISKLSRNIKTNTFLVVWSFLRGFTKEFRGNPFLALQDVFVEYGGRKGGGTVKLPDMPNSRNKTIDHAKLYTAVEACQLVMGDSIFRNEKRKTKDAMSKLAATSLNELMWMHSIRPTGWLN